MAHLVMVLPPHFAGEMLKSQAGIFVVHIPYRGQGPALTDLLAGNIDMMFGNLPDFLPHIKSGKLKAIGTTYLTRAPLAPEIPTIAEQRIPQSLRQILGTALLPLLAYPRMQ